jgi:hypothetical protein
MRRASRATALACAVVALTASATAHAGKVGRIAFGIKASDGNTDVYSVLPDGSGLTRLTKAGSFDACAAYSPDGRSIAFCSDRKSGFEIWLMAANGPTSGSSRGAPTIRSSRVSPRTGGGSPSRQTTTVRRRPTSTSSRWRAASGPASPALPATTSHRRSPRTER